MGIEYSHASEVADIAKELIRKHHQGLSACRIEYVFRSSAAKKGGKELLGKARKVGGLNAFLVGLDTEDEFFVLEIAADLWKELDEEQRKALVDHELCHFGWDADTGRKQIHPHDVEEFADVIRRHGLWSQDVKAFTRVTQQMQLPLDAAEAEEQGSVVARLEPGRKKKP